MKDDEIAALEGDWDKVPPAERAAFQFTLKLTREPHTMGPEDVEALSKHYNPRQIAEIVQAVAGYNSTNRWTDALNIPAEETGEFFRRGANVDPSVELDTFLTPTSQGYKNQVSRVAPIRAEAGVRPPLEPFDSLEALWEKASARKALLPLAGEPGDPAWVRLLQVFQVANKGRIATLLSAETKGKLDARTRVLVDWTCARQDRAWYMQQLISRRAAGLGIGAKDLKEWDQGGPGLSDKEQAVIRLTRKITTAPWTVQDGDVVAVRQHFDDYQVAEVVLHACNAAYLDRVTEAAQLPLDKPSGGPR